MNEYTSIQKRRAHKKEPGSKKGLKFRNKTKQVVTKNSRNRGPKRNKESNEGPNIVKELSRHLKILLFLSLQSSQEIAHPSLPQKSPFITIEKMKKKLLKRVVPDRPRKITTSNDMI